MKITRDFCTKSRVSVLVQRSLRINTSKAQVTPSLGLFINTVINMTSLTYLKQYPLELQNQVTQLIESDRLSDHIRKQYPTLHQYNNDKTLREFALTLKNQYLKKSAPLSKVIYDNKIHVVNNALGLHSYASRVQGGKLKSKNEIRISSVFKESPEAFLRMIVVHELAHLKEKEHNKAFYKLCCHMLPNYHQLEFDMRLYLTHLELLGPVYSLTEKKAP